MPNRIKAGLALLAAGVLAFAVSSHAAPAAVTAPAAAPSETSDAGLAMRQGRLARLIHEGRMEGWLSRQQTRARFGELGRLKRREAELRSANAGELPPAGRQELDQALRTLAHDLLWTRERQQHGRPYQPH